MPEWDVARNSQDAYRKKLLYCPRIDYAIKPLNINTNTEHNNRLISDACAKYQSLLDELIRSGLRCDSWTLNENPRCFLAIEYEHKTSTKHRVGSLVNAGTIGKIGIIVAQSDKVYRSYSRILNYVDFLQLNKKMNMQTNFLAIRKEKFEEILSDRI